MAGEESIFAQGRLEMSARALPEAGDPSAWGELPPNRIGVLVCVVLVLLSLKDIIRLAPALLYALDRVSGSIGLEYNVSKARMRNDIALVSALPFCLLLDRFAVYRPLYWQWIPAAWSGAATLAVMLSFVVLRWLCHRALRIRKLDQDRRSALLNGLYNHFIALCFISVPLAGILSACTLGDSAIRLVILGCTGVAFLLSLIGEVKIFLSSGHSALRTILYLCGLEILPAAVLAASAALL